MEAKPEWLKELSVLTVKPGDTVVLSVKERLKASWRDYIGKILKEKFPLNPIIILEEGMTLGVIRQSGVVDSETSQSPSPASGHGQAE